MIRASLLREIGINQSESLIAAEDYHTWLRIAQFSNNFVYIPRSLGYYRIHKQSVSKKDMSKPDWFAVNNFLPLLKFKERQKAEANIMYTSGRFYFLFGKKDLAIKSLVFSFKYGRSILKVKSLIMLIKLTFRI